ncbi:MAG: sigma-70 family RNA polymerase sigma factor [Acutalibacteraceae bacterium]|nr:sigma-70 family RNA polymerase sigma factor [Acutalibacteraceae bacterium]
MNNNEERLWEDELEETKDTKVQQNNQKQELLVNEYLKTLKGPEYNILSKSEELELFEKYRAGDMNAKDQIIIHNLRFVPYLIKKYNIYSSDVMDLIQAGNMGLVEAIERFMPEKGMRFASYAMFVIRKYLFNEISSEKNRVYIPFGMNYKIHKYNRMIHRAEKMGTEVSDKELMKCLELTDSTLQLLKDTVAYQYTSLDSTMNVGGRTGLPSEKIRLIDTVADESDDLDTSLILQNTHKVLANALKILSAREYDVIVHMYGFEAEKEPVIDIAKRYNITPERVYQIKKQACKKIKKNFDKNGVSELDF